MKPYKRNYFRAVAAIMLLHGERIAENEHDIKQLKEKFK
jgi:hypothetical protein